MIASGESQWYGETRPGYLGKDWAEPGRGGEGNWKTGDWRVKKVTEEAECDRNQSRILPVATLRMGSMVRVGTGTGNITIDYTYYATLYYTGVLCFSIDFSTTVLAV